MHIAQHNIPMWSTKWILLHTLQIFCFFISVTAMIGSIVGVIEDTRTYKVPALGACLPACQRLCPSRVPSAHPPNSLA